VIKNKHIITDRENKLMVTKTGQGGGGEAWRGVNEESGICSTLYKTFQVVLVVKNLPANAGDARDTGLIPEVRKIPWRRK